MSGAVVLKLTNDEYHADVEALSHSGAELFDNDPAEYHGVMLTGRWPRKSSKSMELGSAFDQIVLDEAGVGASAVVIPRAVLSKSGSCAGKKYKEFAAANAGKRLLKDTEPLAEMLTRLRECREAMSLLKCYGETQFTIRWHDDEFGVLRRARLDRFISPPDPLCLDLKTARRTDPKGFSSDAYNFGYHRQAAWYQDAIEALYGYRPPFVFLVVKNSPGYGVELVELDETFLELGRNQNRRILARYAECLHTDTWKSKTHGQILKLSAPNWALYEDEWSYA